MPLAHCAKPTPKPVIAPAPPPPAPVPPPPPPPVVHAPYPAHWLFDNDNCTATAISQVLSLDVTAAAHDLVLTVRIVGRRSLPRHTVLPIDFASPAGNWSVAGHITGKHVLRASEPMNEDTASRVLVLLEGGVVRIGQAGDFLPRMRVPNGGAAAHTWFACISQRLRP